jgi:hypothetical protein
MSKPHKSAAVVARRTEEILRILLDGAEWWDVREFVREKEKEPGSAWELPPDGKPLSDSQIRRYTAKATAMIAESRRASRKKLFRRHLAQRRNLYAKAVSQGDVRAALSVLRDEGELLGLYPPKKIAPTSPDGSKEYGDLTDDERAAALAALYAAVGKRSGSEAAEAQAGADGSLLDGPGTHPQRSDGTGPVATGGADIDRPAAGDPGQSAVG